MGWLVGLLLVVGLGTTAVWCAPAVPNAGGGGIPGTSEPGGNQKQGGPGDDVGASKPDQRGTESAPLTVKLLNTGKSDAEAAQEAKRISEKDSLDKWSAKWTFILTLALVGATILQFLALLYQGYWLRRSVRIAEAALTSAEQAFLFQQGLTLTAIKGSDGHIRGWQFIFNWKNSGSTPARHVLMHTGLHWVDKADPIEDSGDLPPGFDYPDTYGFREPTERVPLSIGPQCEMAGEPKQIDLITLGAAYSRRTRIFVYGWADYTDIFPKTPRHRTEFCFEIVVVANPDTDAAGISTFLFFAYGPHNGAENECYRKAGETARQVPYDTPVWPPPATT